MTQAHTKTTNPGLAGTLEPILYLIQLLTNGLGEGVQKSANELDSTFKDVGGAIQSGVNVIGSATDVVKGVAGTIGAGPAVIYNTVSNL